jgi:hypothetical protein
MAEWLDLFPRMTACFEDWRKTGQILLKLPYLLAQRIPGDHLGV